MANWRVIPGQGAPPSGNPVSQGNNFKSGGSSSPQVPAESVTPEAVHQVPSTAAANEFQANKPLDGLTAHLDNLHLQTEEHSAPGAVNTQGDGPKQPTEEHSVPRTFGTEGDGSKPPTKEHSAPRAVDTEGGGSKPPTEITATGETRAILPKCPESRMINYSLNWYTPVDIEENYLICNKCHADHIEGTALEEKFELIVWPDGVPAVCGFRFPRVKDVLWPEALRTNSIEELCAFMVERLEMKPCVGTNPVNCTPETVVYCLTDNAVDGFVVCEACFAEKVTGNVFANKFSLLEHGGQMGDWTCDLGVPFISRAFTEMSKRNSWQGFLISASRRFQVEKCEGAELRSDEKVWFLPRHHEIPDFRVCEACFLDNMALTPFEDELLRYSASDYEDVEPELWVCRLADKNISTLFALEAAVERKDFSVFAEAAGVICRSVPCTSNGIINGNWWTVDGCPFFDVCEGCHAGILKANGLDQFFELAEREPDATFVCDFSVGAPRTMQFILKLYETLDRGVFSFFSDFVKTFAGVPACPKIGAVKGRYWWGYLEALFCQECFLDFVSETKLAEHLPLNCELGEGDFICQMWSPRMRQLWLEVCDAGEPGTDESEAAIVEFRAFAKQRKEIYHQTLGEIELTKQLMNIKRQQAIHQGFLSVQYKGMDSMARVFGTTDGYQHGNSSLGWYETSYGAESAQMFKNFQNGLTDSNRGEDWMRMAELQRIWKTVE